MTTKLLGFHPSGVRNKKSSVICHQLLLQFHCTGCIDVLGIVRNEGFGDSLANGVNLRSVTSTLHSHANVERCKRFLASNKDRLVHLETQNFRLNEVDR